MPSPCSQLKQEYEQLKALKAAFALEYAKVRESGDLTAIKKLKQELEQARDALRDKLIILHEKKRLKQFFGKDIEVPPLPKGITSDMLQVWETNRFKLEYWPKIDMQENKNFPGWKYKPGKKFTPGQNYGIEFYEELDRIQNLQNNKQNPNLQGLSPTELPGAWVLRDTRPKPNYQADNKTYEDDALIQGVLKNLAQRGSLNKEAAEGRRNLIHPDILVLPTFLWVQV